MSSTRTRVALAPSSEPGPRSVPVRALLLSLLALAAPVVAVIAFPDRTSDGFGVLVWLSALIPAFLLAYYRGLRGVAVALSGGMAVITATQLSLVIFQIAEPNWPLLAGIVITYLVVSVGIAALAEALRRENRSAEDLALVDRLTSLPNRRHLDLTLESAFAAAVRGNTMAVVMFDLDHFKRVNDVHGHAKGDDTLRQFADVLARNTRASDLTARYGGEEFVTVLHDADERAATLFAERVLTSLRQLRFPWGVQTASAGVATYQAGMGSYEILVGAADRALYEAKAAGRDRVSVAPTFGIRDDTAQDSPAPGDAEGTQPSPDAAPAGRVFVVDDNSDLREILRIALTSHGFDVWDSNDPKEAIRHFIELAEGERPGVIVTDVIMPDMTGMTMIEHIERAAPGQRVIYMSGYVHSPVNWAGTSGSMVEFLDKPFALDAMIALVTDLMHRKRDAPTSDSERTS